LSYWDCGEFIACSHILGIPHPPGTPLFILIGRIFDLLPIGSDPAFRINLMSSTGSTITALFAYLITVRLVSSWYDPNGDNYRTGRIIAYAAGFIGALFVAYSRANWTNSIESEPRSMAMAIMMIIFWLGLKFFDHRYNNTGKRIVVLVAFLSMLGVGVHLTVFLVVPFVALFFSLKENATPWEWGTVAAFFIVELLLIIVLSGQFSNYKIFLGLSGILFAVLAFVLRHKVHWPILLSFAALSPIMIGFYPFMFSVIGWFIVTSIIYFVKRTGLWRVAALMILAGIVGWSVYVYCPVRSTNHPIIDENTPSRSFSTFVNFLDRKQYGSMSMTERMFVRRGSWANQFGDHDRMGFWRLFKDQYSRSHQVMVFVFIGLAGMLMLAWKNPKWGTIFIALLLVASAGLVLYMNFADGTKFDGRDAYQEVRNRYYFFTPAFVIFGIAIGMGFGAIMELIRQSVGKPGSKANKLAVYASLILILTPLVPLKANYFYNDRSGNYMAYNYVRNMLNTCKEDAILFTAGDNDTFPVWCFQEIYDYRKDVRVVNFSLLNTDWYVWQLKHFQNVPISLTDKQILWEPYEMPDGGFITKPDEPFVDRVRGRRHWLIPMPDENGSTLRVATLVLEDIILSNKWKYPVYFSTASEDVRVTPLGLTDRLVRQGVLLHLTRDTLKMSWDVPVSDSLFFKVYKYDSMNDTTIAHNETQSGINLGFPEKMVDYHDYVMSHGDNALADSILFNTCEAFPSYWRNRMMQRDWYIKHDDSVTAMNVEREMLDYNHALRRHNPENVFFYQYLGMAYYSLGDYERSEHFLRAAWDLNHDKEMTFRSLLTLYATLQQPGEMIEVSREYKVYHDDDPYANDILRRASAYMQQQEAARQNQPVIQFDEPEVKTLPEIPTAEGEGEGE